MTKKHSLFKSALTVLAALYAGNTVIDYMAKEKKMCNTDKGNFYLWKEGEIYYTKHGSGSPIVFIHNLDTCSSTYEWSKLYYSLSKDHTVYALDLLGCGQSDKPCMTYTNYLYVQLIRDFIHDIVREPADIIVSADSSSFVVMANHMDPTLFQKIIMINPCDPEDMKLETTPLQMILKKILFLPLIGTSLYNYYIREENIRDRFVREYFYDKVEKRYIETYYQSAHAHHSDGRFLYASKLCSYTNIDMSIGLKQKENLHIIESSQRKHSKKIIENYQKINDKITVTYISHAKLLPQLEKDDLDTIIEKILQK